MAIVHHHDSHRKLAWQPIPQPRQQTAPLEGLKCNAQGDTMKKKKQRKIALLQKHHVPIGKANTLLNTASWGQWTKGGVLENHHGVAFRQKLTPPPPDLCLHKVHLIPQVHQNGQKTRNYNQNRLQRFFNRNWLLKAPLHHIQQISALHIFPTTSNKRRATLTVTDHFLFPLATLLSGGYILVWKGPRVFCLRLWRRPYDGLGTKLGTKLRSLALLPSAKDWKCRT